MWTCSTASKPLFVLRHQVNGMHNQELRLPLDGAQPRRTWRFPSWVGALVAGTLLLGTVLLLSPLDSFKQSISPQISASTYSPAASAIEYEYRTTTTNDTRYVGFPGELWEQSMHDLLSGTLIRVSADELGGSKSLPLQDGGYAAGLGVSHNLHCIKKLKQWMYKEHFYPDLQTDGAKYREIRDHADHCLNFIRQSILCQIDYALYTLHWDSKSNSLLHGHPESQKCVNWDKLHGWMESRAANSDMLVKVDFDHDV